MKTSVFVKQMGIKLLTLMVMAFFISSTIFADEVRYSDSWANQGYNLVQSENTRVNIIHSVNSFSFNTMMINGEEMTVINMPGILLPNDEGAPNLPGAGRYIAMPVGATAKLNIVSMQTETYSNIEIAPSPRIPFEDDDSPLHYEKNMEIYGQNAFYPANPVKISEPAKIRGVDVVMLGITPFQYNPLTKELIVLRDIEVEVVFEGGNGQFGDEKYRSRWWDHIMADAIMNYGSLPVMDYNRMHEGGQSDSDGCEYLIITPDGADYVAKADEIAEFRNKQGILTEVFTLTDVGGNTTSAIESFINNAYNNWSIPPSGVLLLGDFGYTISNNVIAPIYDNYCASDNIYADVDGDHLPEMAFGRITANNATQLETMVSKFIDHETNPPTNPDFYNNPITAVGWQTERWFQICGEAVGGYWKNTLGKDPTRINAIYSGTPGSTWSTAPNTATVVNYFGPNGLGYIPAMPSSLGGWTGGNATMINNAIESGAFIMLHRDHGNTTLWGEPYYTTAHIGMLTNEDLTYVMSINCLTGKYNWSGECFTEKFHRHTSGGHNSGAIGLTAASETSYSFVNDTYVWGSIDNMWPGFMPLYGTEFPQDYIMPAFGNASGKYFLQQSSWPYNTGNKMVTYHLFHHHGGAFMTLYSEVPVDLTIVHDNVIPYGSTAFNITANDGSLISLYRNGEILATATGTGSPQVINLPAIPLNADVTLTVTKQNYFRYEEIIPVLEVLQANFEADDTSICPDGVVNFTDLSQGTPVSWLWTFEGGDPASSTDQNPQGIMYSTPGAWDVTLEVSSTTSTDSYTIDDYITVMDNVTVVASVTATAEDICEGEEVTFNVTLVNGGITPAFQWQLNGVDVGDGTDVYVTNSLADGDIVSCEVTSSIECTIANPVMSNDIVMTVNEILPVGIIIETETVQICAGSEVLFTAIPENGGDTPVYQWKVNGSDVGTNSAEYTTSDLADGDMVTCELLSNANCITGNPAMSNEITITVLEELPAGVSIVASIEEICAGDEVTFTATPENGGSEPAYQWKVNGENTGDNSNLFITADLADDDVVKCEMTSSFVCAINNPAMSNPISMSVNPYPVEMAIPSGSAYVDLNETLSSNYTTTNDPNTLTYTWTVTPDEAWENLAPDMHNLTITWKEDFTGQASIHVFGTNDCGDGPVSGNMDVSVENTFGIGENDLNIGVSIFPNPNNGTFTVKFSSANNENVKMKIMSIVGEVVYNEEELSVNGEFIKVIDLSKYAKGVYFLMIENNNKILTEKIVVQK
ncbi:MAG: T9SS type A sorting domain-containing protein [Bacteroidales bacterium]|nr:T9SS type A sorting domain-containing protein [Bacteroidales bacterium]